MMLLEPGISGQRVLPPAHSDCPGSLPEFKFGCFAYLGRRRQRIPSNTGLGPAGSCNGKAGNSE